MGSDSSAGSQSIRYVINDTVAIGSLQAVHCSSGNSPGFLGDRSISG